MPIYYVWSTLATTLQPLNERRACKRRINEDEEEPVIAKRYFDLNTQFSPDQPVQKVLPAITYASPDYRPPPPTETPLWLQPVNANSPMTEDDSEDDAALLTPSYAKLQQQQFELSQQQAKQHQQQQQQQDQIPLNCWSEMAIDQWY
ncbi:hypothetical protein BDF20DRAFT_852376 [Mycotypha africana]|uniref:uncharacterized protein n=1 Tax=Mycotypha africana TaxID=64632 RepID=UPI0023012F7C|nr:uncharacterized protein BDF20DRAFT_852376 [Mycotypha africana]KAI8987821.1 hypothetical protein BDF20DRAFT_852376 [Mycotypha africana]